MTTGETDEKATCGGGGGGGGGGNRKSSTSLSTIAIQAGQSLIVVSVLKSGSLVHLQLVQVHPGLCEIGSNQEENQTLIQEQQQLMEKLKKHEREVLSVVDRSRQTEQRRTRGEGVMEQRRNNRQEEEEEEEEVHQAMVASLNEGWSLLLRLLGRRQEVLTLAADFYCRALEFAVSIDRLDDLLIDSDRLSEVQLTYDSMRRDLLRKSLLVLTSSSVLLQRLRQLQRTEALQRRGGVLQDQDQDQDHDEEEESSQSSQSSRGVALRLEELVEMLQDRRRRANQAVRLQLQQAETGTMIHKTEPESREAGSEDLSLIVDKILDQNPQPGSTSAESPDLNSDSRTRETRDVQPGSRSDVKPGSRSEQTRDMGPGSRLDLKPGSTLEETRDLQPKSRSDPQSGSRSDLQLGFRLELKSGSRPEEIRNLQSGFKLNLKAGSRSYLKPDSKSEETRDLQPGSRLDLQPGSRLDQTPESRSDMQPGSGLDVKPECSSEPTRDVASGFRSEETTTFESGSRLDLKLGPSSEESRDLQPESRSDQQSGSKSDLQLRFRLELKPGSRPEEIRNLQSEFKLDLQPGSRSDVQPESRLHLKPASRSDETRNLQSGSTSVESKDLQPGSRSDVKCESRSDLKPGSGSEQTRNMWPESRSQEIPNPQPISRSETRTLQSGFRSFLKSESRSDGQPGSGSGLKPGSRSDGQPGSGSGLKPGTRSEETRDLQSGSRSEAEDVRLSELSRKQEETKQLRAATTTSGLVAGPESMLGKETQSAEDHAHQAPLTNQRKQLLSSCEHLVDKIWCWVQQGSSVLSNSSEAGRQLFEAEDTLNTHLQLHTQAESAGQDAENMEQILDQVRALHTDWTSTASPQPSSEPSRQLSPLKALTEQLKRGSTGRRTRTSTARLSPPPADPTGSLSPELASRVDLVLKELQSLNRKIDSNLQLLQPYVTFLRTAQQVEEEVEELREIHRRRSEEEEEEEEEKEKEGEAGGSIVRTTTRSRSPVKKKQVDACWQETLQMLLTCQELGNNYVHTVTMVSGAGLNLQSVVSVVQQTVERLSRTKQEVNELRSHQQIQIQQQQEYCSKYQERLLKTLQDLNCVSELLDSCTLMDLGSDLQTSRLLENFSQARPHFIQLDAEVEYMEKSWETLRRVQDRLEVKELKGRAVEEEDLSELLKLQKTVKNKIHQSELILDLTSSFHLTSKQLEALLQSDLASPLTGSTGSRRSSDTELSRYREEQQQIQSLLKMASTLKTDICTTVNHSGWTCFRVEQLEARLLSLDSLCVSWLNEAARREEKLRREQLTRLLNNDIIQVRDSFKELKKRFSNLKFNYVKRNDRTRNMKAVRNQLQQVELYEEKLQALRKRLQGVTGRLGSEVTDGGVAREAEDAVNELQRQMGEFERSVSEHQKTLEMTCRLQQAMEEYQFWCEEASATIARVGKFSSECRSTDAVSVLYRQFEKFVWPTVPQQEERISQITELAVRLHGVEEGRRYIEKTVSKHSEMVESIRELSDGLMELEAKLKLESLKQKQSDGEKEMKEEGETERKRENETEEEEEDEEKDEDTEKKLKENRKMKKKEQRDNYSSQEADMYELKETGHTPELTGEHDGKEVPVKRQTAANRKPPLQKSRSQEADRQAVVSESSHRQQSYSERFTSSYCPTHTFSLSCSPVEANRRVHAIHSQLQPFTVEPQATPPTSVIGPSFSDIQREFHVDASARGLSEGELQRQEMMTDDSLSNDEYECASPDDISLPPLAETPESYMVPSDAEEGFCFSSHSVHINQHSHQNRAQSEHSGTGTGAVRQRRESSQSCPTPPTSLHNSTRFRSESTSFVPSPLAVPASSVLTSTLCSILRTGETSTANIPQSANCSLGGPEPSFPSGSNPAHKSNTQDSCFNKDNNIPEKRSPSETKPLLKGHHGQCNHPQRSAGTQGKTIHNVASKGETFPQTDPVPQAAKLNHSPTLPPSSYCPQPFDGPDPDLHKDKTTPQDTRSLKCSTTVPQTRTAIWQDNSSPQSFPDSERGLSQDIKSSQTRKETFPVTKLQRGSLTNTSTRTVSQQTTYFQSSPSVSHCTLPQASSSLRSTQGCPVSQIDLVPQAGGFARSPNLTDSVLHKDKPRDTGLFKSNYATILQTSTTIPEDSNLPQSNPDPRSGLDQDSLSSQTSKETSSLSMPQGRSLTTTSTVTQQTIYCHSSVPQTSSNLRSQQESPFSQGSGGLPEVQAPILPEPNSISTTSTPSSNRFSSKQSHDTVYSLHESLTSTSTQQCVHDPGMTPSSPAEPASPPQPEAQTQALAVQANLHVTPLSSPPHLLTPDQDPNICQPMSIREEIRLTPQIQGPPIPAPPPLPQAQAESLPQGKASKPGPPCFTRPLSRATVMEGSPVTLEVEVTGHPEPTLTWFKDGEVSAPGPGRAPACEDQGHFLFTPEASDSDGGSYEAWAASRHDPGGAAASRHDPGGAAGGSSSSDEWLVAEVFGIISVDWQTWFGTLCVLLWLLYLILL